MTIDVDAEYRKIKINSGDLTKVVETQAEQHGEFCKGYVLAKSLRDKLESNLEWKFANKAKNIRADVLAKGGKQPTEASIKQSVLLDGDYQRCVGEWLACKEETRHWELLREQSSQRSFMIGHLVELHIKGMLSGKSVKEPTYDEARDKMAEARQNLKRRKL